MRLSREAIVDWVRDKKSLAKRDFHTTYFADVFAISLLGLAAMTSSVLVLAVIGMGFAEIVEGLRYFYTEHNSKKALYHSISGIEFLLLSPLAYFVLRSLCIYVENIHEHNKFSGDAKLTLIEVKALIVGLLFAVVATHTVGQIITPDKGSEVGANGSTEFEPIRTFVLMGILALFFFGLETIILIKGEAKKSSEPQTPVEEDGLEKNEIMFAFKLFAIVTALFVILVSSNVIDVNLPFIKKISRDVEDVNGDQNSKTTHKSGEPENTGVD